MKNSVLALAPLRVSFAGGGTDLPEYYLNHESGIVVSTAINKYVYVHLKRHDPTFSEKYRISYSEVEHCNDLSEVKNSIVAACLKITEFHEPLQISTSADIPAHSGLGSSSALAVALLSAIHEMREEAVSKSFLAEEAFLAEREIANVKCGKQDHYAAAFGGFNAYHFFDNGSVNIEPLTQNDSIEDFIANCVLIWTGQSRSASLILDEQSSDVLKTFRNLDKIKIYANEFKNEINGLNGSNLKLIEIVNDSWKEKMNLSKKIVTKEIGQIIGKLTNFNIGLKIAGAGGGGFILCIARDKKTLEELQNLGYKSLTFKSDFSGSRSIALN
jgi:D-glycero-alpha-D-manno-heptose-7-phosphate kinase